MDEEQVCTLLTERDSEEAARLYTDVFLSDEPTSRRHALDKDRFLPFARLYVAMLVHKELSFIVRDKRTGEMCGFIFCFDLTCNPADESDRMREFIGHFREAVAMIDELEEKHIRRDAISPGVVLHIFQIGVGRTMRRRGTATSMIHHALTHAWQRGFRQAIADCTNATSRQAFRQCGFTEAGALSYDDFSYAGNRFFAGLEGGISLMVRDL